MARPLYLDSSAILRAVLERGLSPDLEARLSRAEALFTSRLSLVETARAFLRVRLLGEKPERDIADAERSVRSLWHHCEIWELRTSEAITTEVAREIGELAVALRERGLDAHPPASPTAQPPPATRPRTACS